MSRPTARTELSLVAAVRRCRKGSKQDSFAVPWPERRQSPRQFEDVSQTPLKDPTNNGHRSARLHDGRPGQEQARRQEAVEVVT
jgi:hypothetical protein